MLHLLDRMNRIDRNKNKSSYIQESGQVYILLWSRKGVIENLSCEEGVAGEAKTAYGAARRRAEVFLAP